MKYSASFKLQVVKFASDNSNNSAASRKFGIDEKLVRDWRRKIDNIKSLPKTKCAGRGRKCQWPELEKKVVEWVEANRKSWLAVTRNLIRLHAKKTAQQMNIDNFLISSGWCTRFMKRNKLVLRQKTKISQRLPDDLVSLNKPFKDRLREKWMTWIMSGEKTFTPGGQLRAASLVTVCQWVKESWQELSKEMVERSFKKCGISNALEGTEDDLVWEEEEDSSQVEEEPDCDVYDDRITPEQWQELFGESDDEEEFHGF